MAYTYMFADFLICFVVFFLITVVVSFAYLARIIKMEPRIKTEIEEFRNDNLYTEVSSEQEKIAPVDKKI